jgi:REP-associated tyrosine transposase
MPRSPRCCPAGCIIHVLNRGVRRKRLFRSDDDYRHFQELLGRAGSRASMRLVAYCLMPNHWHLVVWPQSDQAVSAYVQWLSSKHACYFNRTSRTVGHVYERRFRSVVVRDDRHLWTLLQYVENNPARAGMVARAEQWKWSSLTPCPSVCISQSPVPRPSNWLELLATSTALPGSDTDKPALDAKVGSDPVMGQPMP